MLLLFKEIETDTFSFVLLEVIIWKVCSSFSKLFLVLLFFKFVFKICFSQPDKRTSKTKSNCTAPC